MLNRTLLRSTAELLAWQVVLVAAGFAQTPDLAAARTTIASLQKKAEAGDVQAATSLGVAYRDGDGVPADASKAAEWFRRAAEQGDAAAQNCLGVLYQTGSGVP